MTTTPWDLTNALRLIAITDHVRDGIDGLTSRTAAAVRGGATMVQVRLKDADARLLVEVARRFVRELSVPIVVNDRVDVALAAGAAGVHVGADDLPVNAVRAMTPTGFIIGASLGAAHESANASLADYVGIGPFFATASKSDAGTAIGAEGFAALSALVALPRVAIGGITAATAGQATRAGADGVAVIGALLGAADAERAARALRAALAT